MTSPSEAAANGNDVSIHDLAKHIRSIWGVEGGKYDRYVKALVDKVLARGDKKLTEILGDIPGHIERGAKSLNESPVLVSPRDPIVENGFTPEQKYKAEMRRWENAEAAAKKYGVENMYPRPQKPAPKAEAPSADALDEAKATKKPASTKTELKSQKNANKLIEVSEEVDKEASAALDEIDFMSDELDRGQTQSETVQSRASEDNRHETSYTQEFGEGFAGEGTQRAIAEIIDDRRAASSIRRSGVKARWEPGREIIDIAKRNGCFVSLEDFKNLIGHDYYKPDFAGGEHQV